MAKYSPAPVVAKTKLTSADRKLVMIVACTQGKSGFNTKASIKKVGDADTKALTGARATFKDEAGGRSAFDKIVKEAVGKGWVVDTITSRNSFTNIPAPKEVKFGEAAVVVPKSQRGVAK